MPKAEVIDHKTYVLWLRAMADQGGKGVVNNIDARALGRVADEIENLEATVKKLDAALQASFKELEALASC